MLQTPPHERLADRALTGLGAPWQDPPSGMETGAVLDVDLKTKATQPAMPACEPRTPAPRRRETSIAAPRPADAIDRLLQRAILQRNGSAEVADRRFVESADGEVELLPLTLGDFLFHAVAESGRRDRRRRNRAGPAVAERAEAEGLEQERLRKEEEARLEAEQREAERLEAEEQARREAEEQARREAEEQERLRLEAEEMERLRVEAEAREQQRLEDEQKEKQRLKAEAAAKALVDWEDGLKRIAAELAGMIRDGIGPDLWPWLTNAEQTDAVREALELAGAPITRRTQAESSLRAYNKKHKKNQITINLASVLTEIKEQEEPAALKTTKAWASVAQGRKAEDAKQKADAILMATPVSLAERASLMNKPTGNQLDVLYRAMHQNWITLIHNSSYRTEPERQEKTNKPFSREFSVRVYGTKAGENNRYEWANWVIHVHYKSAAQPTTSEYMHIKGKSEKYDKINYVINKRLASKAGPKTIAAIEAAKDNAIGV